MHEYPELMSRHRTKVARTVGFGLIVLALCAGAALSVRTLFRFMSEPTPTATSPAIVVPGTSTAALTPAPAGTPAATETPAPTPIPASTLPPEPSPIPPSDLQGDVGAYESGDQVEGVPAGVDIRAASVGADLQVVLQPTEGVPAELAGWATEDEVLLWISLYDPVPDPPAVFTDWVVVLDLDGDVATGRPAGEARINPDLGYEAAIGVSYNNASGKYEPYFLVWNPTQANLASQPEEPRFTMNEARTLIGLALSLETLTQNVDQTTGVTLVPEGVKGRAAVVSWAGGQRVVDFYPNRPD